MQNAGSMVNFEVLQGLPPPPERHDEHVRETDQAELKHHGRI